MLRTHSLRRQADFDRVFASGRRYRAASMTVVVSPRDPGSGPSRAAFVVSRKVSGKAVTRNRLRRQLRELFRHWRGQFTQTADLVIIMRPGTVGITYPELEATLQRLLSAAGLLSG